MSKYMLWTLDNVLVDDSWRVDFIDRNLPLNERRFIYDMLAVGDDPITTQEFEQGRDADLEPLFVVDRPEQLMLYTEIWIRDNLGVAEPKVIMRATGDFRPTHEVIAEAVATIGPDQFAAVFTDDALTARKLVDTFGVKVNMISRGLKSLKARHRVYE